MATYIAQRQIHFHLLVFKDNSPVQAIDVEDLGNPHQSGHIIEPIIDEQKVPEVHFDSSLSVTWYLMPLRAGNLILPVELIFRDWILRERYGTPGNSLHSKKPSS